MTMPSIDQILADDNLSPSKKLLLIVLARHAHSDGTHCYPSLRRLQRLSSLSLAHVCTLLAELENTGHLSIQRFKGPKGVNAYILHMPGAPVSRAPVNGARSTGAPVSEAEVQSEERKEVRFQPEEHQPVVLQSVEHHLVPSPYIEVTPEAVHLVSSYGLGSGFLQVLQGKEPASSNDPPAPAEEEPPSTPPPARRSPRKVSFDETRFALGAPCPEDQTHRYGETGKTVRLLKTQGCYLCTIAAKKAARQVQGG